MEDVLIPFLSAILLAYVMNPVVNRLVRYRLPRLLAVLLIFFLIIGLLLLLLLLLVPLMAQQIHLLMTLLPQMILSLQEKVLPWIQSTLGTQVDSFNVAMLKNTLATHWQSAGDVITVIWQTIAASSMALLSGTVNVLLIGLVTFYLLLDWDLVLESAKILLPQRIAATVLTLCGEANAVIGAFFRGQLWVMVLLGLFYGIGLAIMGLNIGLLIGLMAGLLSVVPYLGFVSGMLIAILVSLFQFHGISHCYPIVALFFVGHVLESFWLTPMLVGDKIGLHPIAVIFAIVMSGECFGFMGVLLALPLAAVLKVLLRYGYRHYLNSSFYLMR